MKSIFKSIAFASLALTLLLSCAREEIGGPELEDGQMELTVTGVLGEYEAAEGTKASLVNTLRVGWANGDQVYVFQESDGKYLGPLTATADNGGKVAKLGGTISSGSGTLVFVYSNTAFTQTLTQNSTYAALEINLASQGADTPFVVYGTADYPGTTTPSGLVVNFSFATSVVSAYASGLPATTAITEASLEGAGINTVCSLNIKNGGAPVGNIVGTITKTGLSSSNSAGQAMVQFAVPACTSGARKCYLIAGKKYETTLVGSDALLVATAYSAIAPMEIFVINLSSEKTANCYIVSASGPYKFKATVKGNSTDSVGTPDAVAVLWESFGTSSSPEVGDLVKNVTLNGDYVFFEATDNKGNAVIAVKNGSTILWSWHIWLTDEPEDQTYNNSAGKMMDRNLGATSTTMGDVKALGLLYQWGRKDPFLGANDKSSSTLAVSTGSWPSAVAGTQDVTYSVQNPTTFIKNSSSPYNWTTQDNLWGSTKSVYDPCPPGYRVPDGGSSGVWSTAFATSSSWTKTSNWDDTNKGMNFGKTDKTLGSADTIWYPAAGYRYRSDGTLNSVGSSGNYWSCTPNGTNAYYLYFNNDGGVGPASSYSRAGGQSVRCLRE